MRFSFFAVCLVTLLTPQNVEAVNLSQHDAISHDLAQTYQAAGAAAPAAGAAPAKDAAAPAAGAEAGKSDCEKL